MLGIFRKGKKKQTRTFRTFFVQNQNKSNCWHLLSCTKKPGFSRQLEDTKVDKSAFAFSWPSSRLDILRISYTWQFSSKKKVPKALEITCFFRKKNNKERKTIITPKLSFQKDVLVHQLDVVEYLPTRLPVSMGNPLGRHLGRLKISRQAGQIHHLAADFFGAQLKKTAKWWQHRNFRRSFLIFLLFKKKCMGFCEKFLM